APFINASTTAAAGIEAATAPPVPLPAALAAAPAAEVPAAMLRSRLDVRTEPGTRVETETLGPVTIALERAEGALRVHFTVDRGSTAHALIDAAQLLDRSLTAAGTRLEALSVDVRGSGANTTAQADAGGQRQSARDQRQAPPQVTPPVAAPPAEGVAAKRWRSAPTPDRFA
ncbi:MAG: flagellar hook-length control protein FliK, partial [Polymorphobacter sp.]